MIVRVNPNNKDMMYCINEQRFIPSNQISSHDSTHEVISREEFIQVMDANIDACINYLKASNSSGNDNNSGLKSQIDSANNQFNIYSSIMNSFESITGQSTFQKDLMQMRSLHEKMISLINPNSQSNYNPINSPKIQILESVKSLLYNELTDLSKLNLQLNQNFDNRDKDLIFSKRLYIPYNERYNQIPQLQSRSRLPGVNDLFSDQQITQTSPKIIQPNSYQVQSESIIQRIREDKFTFYYDVNRHALNLITIPNLMMKQISFQPFTIPSVPSIALSGSKLLITGGFTIDNYRQSRLTFLLTWSALLDENPIIRQAESMIYQKQDHGIIILGERQAFTIGGLDSEKGILRNCEKYSIGTGIWKEIPSIPDQRKEFCLCSLNERTLFLIGGFSGEGSETRYHKSILSYDVDFDQIGWKTIVVALNEYDWIEVSSMIAYGNNPDSLLLFGGRGLQGPTLNLASKKCFEINVNSGSFKRLPMDLNNKDGDFFLVKYNNVGQKNNNLYFISAKNQLYTFSLLDKNIQSFAIDKV